MLLLNDVIFVPFQYIVYPLIFHLSIIPLIVIMTFLSAIANMFAAILAYGYTYNTLIDKKIYLQGSLHGLGVLITSPFLFYFSIFLTSFFGGTAGFQITLIMFITYFTGFIGKCLLTFKIWGNRSLLKIK